MVGCCYRMSFCKHNSVVYHIPCKCLSLKYWWVLFWWPIVQWVVPGSESFLWFLAFSLSGSCHQDFVTTETINIALCVRKITDCTIVLVLHLRTKEGSSCLENGSWCTLPFWSLNDGYTSCKNFGALDLFVVHVKRALQAFRWNIWSNLVLQTEQILLILAWTNFISRSTTAWYTQQECLRNDQ